MFKSHCLWPTLAWGLYCHYFWNNLSLVLTLTWVKRTFVCASLFAVYLYPNVIIASQVNISILSGKRCPWITGRFPQFMRCGRIMSSEAQRVVSALLGWSTMQTLGARRQNKLVSPPSNCSLHTHPHTHSSDGWAIIWRDRKPLSSLPCHTVMKNSSQWDSLLMPFSPLCVMSWILGCVCHLVLTLSLQLFWQHHV